MERRIGRQTFWVTAFAVVSAATATTFTNCTPEGAPPAMATDAASIEPPLLSPNSVTMSGSGSLDFEVFGGAPPFQFQVLSGTATLVSIGERSARLTVPGNAGQINVRVQDSRGAFSDALINVTAAPPGQLQISPTGITLLNGQQVTFTVSGGTPPYTLTANSGNVSGLAWTPNQVGTATVTARDSANQTAAATATVTAPPPAGSYQLTCQSCTINGSAFSITCMCRTINGSLNQTSIIYGNCPGSSLTNNNGILVCGP